MKILCFLGIHVFGKTTGKGYSNYEYDPFCDNLQKVCGNCGRKFANLPEFGKFVEIGTIDLRELDEKISNYKLVS